MAIEGKWQLKFNSSMGEQTPVLTLNADGSGKVEMPMGGADFTGAKLDGDSVEIGVSIDAMGQSLSLKFKLQADGDAISGELVIPDRGGRPVTGERLS